MADENNRYLVMIVLGFVFFFIGGLKLYQKDLFTAGVLIIAAVLIFISYLLLTSDINDRK